MTVSASDAAPGNAAAAATRQRVLMVTVVWGSWYLDAHLDLNLPTLLAPGNLPAMAARHDLTYVIMTIATDAERIRSAPAVEALAKLMTVDIRIIPNTETKNPIDAHQRAWTKATEEAKQAGSFVLYMPPDVAWSDGSFAHLARLLDQGYAAIFMTYLRVVSETFTPALQQRRAEGDTAIVVAGRDLVRLSLEHVHPLMAAHMHDSRYFPIHPEMVVWPVAGEGLAIRCLAREMFLFDPGRIDMGTRLLIDGRFDRGSMVFVDDSDDLYAVSLAPLGKDVGWHLTAGQPDLMAVARWWLVYDSPVNDIIAAHCLRWHTGETDPARWRRVALASHRWIRRQIALREALRVWKVLIDEGAWNAAALLALAMNTGAVAHGLPESDRPMLVFVPPEDRIEAVLEAGPTDPQSLADLLRRHVCFQDGAEAEPLAPGTIATADGAARAVRDDGTGLQVGAVAILGEPRRAGRHLVYRVGDLLDR